MYCYISRLLMTSTSCSRSPLNFLRSFYFLLVNLMLSTCGFLGFSFSLIFCHSGNSFTSAFGNSVLGWTVIVRGRYSSIILLSFTIYYFSFCAFGLSIPPLNSLSSTESVHFTVSFSFCLF